MSRFPAVTETFILRELVELERQGVEVVLVPLLHDAVSVLHPDARVWDARALYTPFVDGRILAANLALLMRAPWRYLRAWGRMLWTHRSSGNALLGTLGIFPKAVWAGRRLRELGVSHVHAHYATHPATAAWIASRVHLPGEQPLPYSVTAHAHDIFVSRAGLALKLGDASFVRCISRFNAGFLARALAREGARWPAEHLPVIHCGIHPERYRRDPVPGVPGVDRPARLLCIASHRPYKGLPVLIDAVRTLRDRHTRVVCDVIGEGVLRPQLEARIRARGLEGEVRLVGTRTESEVSAEISKADLFVLPSVVAPDGQMEGIPIVLMEALAAGVPTIASALSGIPELVVDGETGRTVPPGDAQALADAVDAVLGDYPRALERARAGATRVRRDFAIDHNVGLLVERIAETSPIARTSPGGAYTPATSR